MRCLLPHPAIQKKHESCPVKGCGKPSKGKPYCPEHMTVEKRRKLNSDLSAIIRSHCHDAKCFSGAPHDTGEQYCSKCKEPCCWKAP